jgi:hypothetical protein
LSTIVQPAARAGETLQLAIHEREVPWHDQRAHADRLAARVAEDLGHADGDDAALDLRRPAGDVAQVRHGRRHVDRAGELQGLAVVERLELGQLAGVGLDRVGQRRDEPAPVGGAHRAPRRARLEGRSRRGHRGVDLGGAGQRHRGDRPPGGRVEGREGAAVGRRPELAGGEGASRLGELLGERGGHAVSRTIFNASRRS